jgi:hypothetical protein
MDSSFGVLDAFAFLVFAVLLIAGVIIVVSLAGSAFQWNILNYVWSRWSGSRGDGEAT